MALNDARKSTAVAIAKELGTNALTVASELSITVRDYIQRGPEGVGWLCFMGGLSTIILGFLGLINVFDVVLEPLEYLVNWYDMIFGLTTCIIEAPQEWVARSEKLKGAQRFIHEYAKFLTTFGGRGLFYLFQGSMAMSLTGVSLSYFLGCYMLMLGLLSIAMQFGFNPDCSFLRGDGSPSRGGDYIHVT